jgi:hypothetical protein
MTSLPQSVTRLSRNINKMDLPVSAGQTKTGIGRLPGTSFWN